MRKASCFLFGQKEFRARKKLHSNLFPHLITLAEVEWSSCEVQRTSWGWDTLCTSYAFFRNCPSAPCSTNLQNMIRNHARYEGSNCAQLPLLLSFEIWIALLLSPLVPAMWRNISSLQLWAETKLQTMMRICTPLTLARRDDISATSHTYFLIWKNCINSLKNT